MQLHPVKLPSDFLIPALYFCTLIARAISPRYTTREGKLEGIKCVWAKRYPSDRPDADVPHQLSEVDRQIFAKLLRKLPPLVCPMTEEAEASFMDAYLNLPKRPTWLPLFETQASILEHERKHRQIIDDHVTALREDHKAGRFVLVDKEHRVVTAVQMGAHLSRKDAIAYLERHLLTYVDEIEAQDITGDEKMVAIAKFHAELKAKRDPSPTKNTAIAFNVDESYVRRANRKAKAEKEQKPVKKRTFKDGKEVLLR